MKNILQSALLTISVLLIISIKVDSQSFPFKYYEVYKDNGSFDSSRLWRAAKLIKTFSNPGVIYFNSQKTIKWKLKEDGFQLSHYIFLEKKDYYLTINGWRVFRYNDMDAGPSIAVHQYPKNQWVIYRQRKIKSN